MCVLLNFADLGDPEDPNLLRARAYMIEQGFQGGVADLIRADPTQYAILFNGIDGDIATFSDQFVSREKTRRRYTCFCFGGTHLTTVSILTRFFT